MLKISLFATIVIGLSGCAAQTQLAKVNSNEWTELTCSGFLTWNECRQEAQAMCPRGFYTADHLENWLIQRRVVSVACKA
jgi:hypothetical protein